ncbi:MAG: M20/M25/M40 family metallo-hydrolase, partial [Planctomycetes bacterium]|nr:M20/M25/M40 family metallo-hydrolase [Planctomycetota bacterium]
MNETGSHPPERFEWLAAAGMLLFLVLSAALSIWMLRPPRVVPASAPATEFSAERALAHLQVIAAAPHPIGSPEHGQVRDYLLRELTALGVDPNVQQAPAPFVFGVPTAGVVVQNIFAKLNGSSERKAILLAAHYDSRPRAPGAADDGAGVAALLETVRALRSGPPLENDVMVLITDGEEAGLLGARAFVGEAEHIENVALVMNFEARG